MKLISALVSGMGLVSAFWPAFGATTAWAAPSNDSGDLIPFFQSLEGKWSGSGTLTKMNGDGQMVKAPLTTEFEIDSLSEPVSEPKGNGRWSASIWVTSNQESVQNSFTYVVRDGILFIKEDDSVVPAKVIESSPWSLTYQTQVADFYTGRVYCFTFQTEIDPSGHTLRQHNTAEINGTVFWDEAFEARK